MMESLWGDVLVAMIAALVTALLAWLVGTRVAYRWDDLKRRRESDLSDRARFYRIYGEFFAVWKAWDTHITRPALVVPDGLQWALLDRAAQVEGEFEALLVKVASERRLGDREVTLLACYRQAYQRLRERIRGGRRLEWWAMNKPGRGTGYQEYQMFKALSEWFVALLAHDEIRGRLRVSAPLPPRDAAIRRLLGVTAVVVDWESEARRLLHADGIVDLFDQAPSKPDVKAG